MSQAENTSMARVTITTSVPAPEDQEEQHALQMAAEALDPNNHRNLENDAMKEAFAELATQFYALARGTSAHMASVQWWLTDTLWNIGEQQWIEAGHTDRQEDPFEPPLLTCIYEKALTGRGNYKPDTIASERAKLGPEYDPARELMDEADRILADFYADKCAGCAISRPTFRLAAVGVEETAVLAEANDQIGEWVERLPDGSPVRHTLVELQAAIP